MIEYILNHIIKGFPIHWFEYLYIPLILVLYLRTWRYNYLIDDQVPRGGYLWVCYTGKQDESFQEKRRPLMATVTNVGVYLATCVAVHAAFGWKAALIFSMMPTNVSGVAWITGNYYMTTVLLCMAGWVVSQWSVLAGIPFFWVGLESTISAVPMAALMMATQPSWESAAYVIPLVLFLFGKRFRTALRLRKENHVDKGISAGSINWRNIFIVPRVLAYYTVLNLFPSRLGFFHDYTKNYEDKGTLYKADRLVWLSTAFLGLFAYWAFSVSYIGALWWFLFIGMWCQFVQYGQFISERYMYLANVGFAMVMAAFITNPLIFSVYVTLLFYRSWLYVPCWSHNKTLFRESMFALPYAQENYNNLSAYYADKGLYVKAVEPLLVALRVTNPYDFALNANIAECYKKCGMYDKALFYSRHARLKCPASQSEKLENWIKDLELKLFNIQCQQKRLRKAGII